MKKDIFHGKIKKEYYSYILIYMIFIALLMLVVGGMFLGVGLWANAGPVLAIIFMRIFGVVIIALGIAYVVGCMLVIRKYPKHEKLRRMLYNSDCYFADSNSQEYRGGRRGELAFALITQAAEQNKGAENVKYPRKCRVYTAIALILVAAAIGSLIAMAVLSENKTALPAALQNDGIFYAVFFGAAALAWILAILFSLRSDKIKEAAILEWRKKQRERGETPKRK